jgi:hypothetical protein
MHAHEFASILCPMPAIGEGFAPNALTLSSFRK